MLGPRPRALQGWGGKSRTPAGWEGLGIHAKGRWARLCSGPGRGKDSEVFAPKLRAQKKSSCLNLFNRPSATLSLSHFELIIPWSTKPVTANKTTHRGVCVCVHNICR